MRNRKKETEFEKMLAKAIVFAASTALEAVPVIGPVIMVVSLIGDVQQVRRKYASE